ncbi:hypothetical protein ACFV1W_20880 [Kitasatospora sp. NPDC059648]|uniref:hypothetical protein n=1 Tax=Kitasatospora sp. NPDC059648 TaxID=3346894 RepID=UPI0036A5A5B2
MTAMIALTATSLPVDVPDIDVMDIDVDVDLALAGDADPDLPATVVRINAWRPDSYDLGVLYDDAKEFRCLTYTQIPEANLHLVRAGRRVAAVFYRGKAGGKPPHTGGLPHRRPGGWCRNGKKRVPTVGGTPVPG